jgi:hypothetical protein
MISLRYAPALCGLLALALVPTIIHSYSSDSESDGRSTSSIPLTLAGYAAVPSARNATWGKRRFDSNDWTERIYATGSGQQVRLTVIRSYDAKALYHHPELAVTYHEASFAGEAIWRFPQRPDIPVHVLKPAPGVAAGAMYILTYDKRFVDNPIPFQIRTAGELLFSRKKPMTLFFVFEQDAPDEHLLQASRAATLLFAAVDHFLSIR